MVIIVISRGDGRTAGRSRCSPLAAAVSNIGGYRAKSSSLGRSVSLIRIII